jgi:hypothetical protein
MAFPGQSALLQNEWMAFANGCLVGTVPYVKELNFPVRTGLLRKEFTGKIRH